MNNLQVVIDSGHGGSDPGAVSSSGVREKDLTGHLENDIVTKTIKELKDNEKEEKEEDDNDDFQLLRALDFIKGINFYNKK